MNKFKYLRVTTDDFMWGKHSISKQYLVGVAQSSDALINLEDMTYFDKSSNQWKDIEGDEPESPDQT